MRRPNALERLKLDTAARRAENARNRPLYDEVMEVQRRAPRTPEHLEAVNALRTAMNLAPLTDCSTLPT